MDVDFDRVSPEQGEIQRQKGKKTFCSTWKDLDLL